MTRLEFIENGLIKMVWLDGDIAPEEKLYEEKGRLLAGRDEDFVEKFEKRAHGSTKNLFCSITETNWNDARRRIDEQDISCRYPFDLFFLEPGSGSMSSDVLPNIAFHGDFWYEDSSTDKYVGAIFVSPELGLDESHKADIDASIERTPLILRPDEKYMNYIGFALACRRLLKRLADPYTNPHAVVERDLRGLGTKPVFPYLYDKAVFQS